MDDPLTSGCCVDPMREGNACRARFVIVVRDIKGNDGKRPRQTFVAGWRRLTTD